MSETEYLILAMWYLSTLLLVRNGSYSITLTSLTIL